MRVKLELSEGAVRYASIPDYSVKPGALTYGARVLVKTDRSETTSSTKEIVSIYEEVFSHSLRHGRGGEVDGEL